ncbi:alpha/beta hydrolase [Amycolatopsis pithecellobii]|uniref:Serine aminopeptidase S33 domain-containing protein n=1 Tax=Amycolatopsis pithecellobii TaxID=664692 RepID=A0A6N7YZB4_9PSEU|nr:alpha/beta fold hydrolase [Amycolatopsis pithecellobii]MTD54253.1 hypothetical protein [Amycolatopsis pithecellobii]
MTTQSQAVEELAIVRREHTGRRIETEEALAALPAESQAALRQFSLERTMGYGVDYSDAVELRARVLGGQRWQEAATELAGTCLRRADDAGPAPRPTRIAYLRRSSALLRISQIMMLADTDERRTIFGDAAEQYARAAELSGDRERVTIETPGGPLAGWLLASDGPAVGSAVVVGGVEGWAMDFDSVGEALAARGIDALMLDGPGQGETRLTHRHYLTPRWLDAFRRAIDFLDAHAPGLPIGVIGNSMGGSFAMAVAASDTRIRACVDNGGAPAPSAVPPAGTFFTKMLTYAGTDETEQGLACWRTVTPLAAGPNAGYPLLVVHGGKDPLVSDEMALTMLRDAPTADKKMVVFSDGDHCIYNHKRDRDVLIADWLRLRLAEAKESM